MALRLTFVFAMIVAASQFDFTETVPDGYVYIEAMNNYYKLHRNKIQWQDAKQSCDDEGGSHFYPQSNYELEKIIHAFGLTGYISVGISDAQNRGTYMTIDGRPVSQVFNKWRSEHPGSYVGCVYLDTTNRELGVYTCTSTEPYICQLERGTGLVEAMKKIIDDASDRLTGVLEKQAAAMQAQTNNETSVLERLANAITNQGTAAARRTETMQRKAAVAYRQLDTLLMRSGNQTTLLEMLVQATRNQTTVLAQMLEMLQDDTKLVPRPEQ